MIESQPIVVAERLLGAAVSQHGGWSFVAADPVVADLHGQRFPSLAEARRIAGLVFDWARAIPATPPGLRRVGPPGLVVLQNPRE